MFDLKSALVRCNWYNALDSDTRTSNFIISEVKNYTEAMAKAEEYLSDMIESIEIVLLDGPFCEVSDEVIERIMKGDYKDED